MKIALSIFLLSFYAFGLTFLFYTSFQKKAPPVKKVAGAATQKPEDPVQQCSYDNSRMYVSTSQELCKKEGKAPDCVLNTADQIAVNNLYVKISTACAGLEEKGK